LTGSKGPLARSNAYPSPEPFILATHSKDFKGHTLAKSDPKNQIWTTAGLYQVKEIPINKPNNSSKTNKHMSGVVWQGFATRQSWQSADLYSIDI